MLLSTRWVGALCVAAMVVIAPLQGRAQEVTRDCGNCLLGVYDDGQMTRTSGTISPFQVKTVYLGIRLGPGMSISNLKFEAVYPLGFTVLDVFSYITGASYIPNGNGVVVDWPACVSGTKALFRVRVFTFGSVRDAVVMLRNAEVGSCQAPAADRWRIGTGCYVLNPSARPPACSTGLAPSTWTAMKGLFK